VIVLRPCRSTAAGSSADDDDTLLEIHYPYIGGDEQVLTQANSFEQWARQQQGVDLKKALLHPETPFFGDNATHAIASRIRAAQGKLGASAADIEILAATQFRSRLFLEIAHQFDVRSWDMAQNMAKLDTLENHLYESLHASEPAGEAFFSDRQTLSYDAFDTYMVAERIDAWCDMAAAYLEQSDAPPLLVTTSRAVIDYLGEQLPKGRTVMQHRFSLENAPFGKIRDRIRLLVTDPDSTPCTDNFDDTTPAPPDSAIEVHLLADAQMSFTESLAKVCGKSLHNVARRSAAASSTKIVYISLTK
jgi:hypothetical protein